MLFRYLLWKKVARPHRNSLLKDLIGCPDDFSFNLEVVNNEIVIRIKKREKEAE